MNFFINKNSIRANFWALHIFSWLGFMMIDFISNRYRINSTSDFLIWLDSDLMGFLIITFIRFFYKKMFSKYTYLFVQISIIILFSILGAVVWFVIRGYSHVLFFPKQITSFTQYFKVFTVPQGLVAEILWLGGVILGWSLAYLGYKYYWQLIEEKSHSKDMQLFAKNAQLQMLRYQLNPHFLFNSLNSIQALMYKDVEKADLMLTELSEFLRTTLSFNEKILISIKEEIDIIERYLTIEKIRFNERLDYKISFEQDILHREIICFITQPLVENAIKHGLTNNSNGIKLFIMFTKIEDYLVIEIKNTGFIKKGVGSDGKGIKNVIARLDSAYSDKYIYSINDADNFVTIRILIPESHEF